MTLVAPTRPTRRENKRIMERKRIAIGSLLGELAVALGHLARTTCAPLLGLH